MSKPMARPISKVTINNFYTVQSYFQNLLERDGLYGKYSNPPEREAEWKAKSAFDELPQVDYSNDKKEEASQKTLVDALQAWIDQHAKHQWSKFLALQRQRKFKKKYRVRALELHPDAYHQLKHYAEKVNLTLSEAVEKLAKTELDKLRDQEWEQEQAKAKKVTK